MTQLNFLTPNPFNASEVKRLTGNILAVYEAMKDKQWLTRSELRTKVGMSPDADICRYIRFLRENAYGDHTVEKRHRDRDKGVTEYRLLPNTDIQVQYRLFSA